MKRILLPVALVGLTLASRAQTNDRPPKPPEPPSQPKVELTKYVPPTAELAKFYEHNPGVSSLYWTSPHNLRVIHKDKTEFNYNMNSKEEKAAFESKYGEQVITSPPPLPPVPPPPPPKPPKPPKQS